MVLDLYACQITIGGFTFEGYWSWIPDSRGILIHIAPRMCGVVVLHNAGSLVTKCSQSLGVLPKENCVAFEALLFSCLGRPPDKFCE
jgi:hypothetical protein